MRTRFWSGNLKTYDSSSLKLLVDELNKYLSVKNTKVAQHFLPLPIRITGFSVVMKYSPYVNTDTNT
jgi:hypothetical protein